MNEQVVMSLLGLEATTLTCLRDINTQTQAYRQSEELILASPSGHSICSLTQPETHVP